uniref:Phosphatidylinositol transfer protein cytoplasmic 1 n=1 Tax=Scleropages formosus TaxID=113540 RepID=A0A8C9TXJ2_SCLFO
MFLRREAAVLGREKECKMGSWRRVREGDFTRENLGGDCLSLALCSPVQDRAAVHHQQAQPRGERQRRGGGGDPQRAAPRPRARGGPAHGEEGSPVQCSFLPKFSIHIETKYEDNCGNNDNIFNVEKNDDLEVDFLDIAYDEIPERHYKSGEDLRHFSSQKTGRGPLKENWRENTKPVMCSYKLVRVKFEVWGLQTRVEQFVHKVIRDILLVAHRQAFAWVDEWYAMTLEDVRKFEAQMHVATNQKLGCLQT